LKWQTKKKTSNLKSTNDLFQKKTISKNKITEVPIKLQYKRNTNKKYN